MEPAGGVYQKRIVFENGKVNKVSDGRGSLRMRIVTTAKSLAIAVVMFVVAAVSAAQAGIVITVDKSAQRLTVDVNGVTHYQWPVSTARWGYRTPNGSYRPERLERQWYSRKYDWSPMPYSIFFHHGYAIHGSNEVSRLGRPASHGCIRLHPQNAAVLFDLVKQNTGNTRIVVIGGGEELMAVRAPARPSAAVFVETRPGSTVRYVAPRDGRQSFEEIFSEPPRHNGSYTTRRATRRAE
jgi:lipoprotein-anchoring transpeptidase ErfK/SrfK